MHVCCFKYFFVPFPLLLICLQTFELPDFIELEFEVADSVSSGLDCPFK